MKALELSGQIDEHHALHLDQPIPVEGPCHVRVLLLIPEDGPSEDEWLRGAARNPAFEFLSDSAEDIYTVEDGRPIVDEG